MNRKNHAHILALRKRVLVSLVLTVLLIVFIPMSAFAMPIAQDDAEQQENEYSINEALLYALAPDHILPFVYYGSAPSPWREIDTSTCTAGCLYVFDKNTNSVTAIGNAAVTSFAATNDYLYFVTSNQEILQADYSGTNITMLYQAAQGEISEMSAFGNTLYFIEGGKSVITLDIVSQNAKTVLTQGTISAVYMFDYDQFVWYDEDGNAYHFNAVTSVNTSIASEYAINCLVNAHSSEEGAEGLISTYAVALTGDSYNDVDFPLEEYPADEGENWTMPTVKSYFTIRYCGAGQCDGFAKYAHDKFFHIYDESRTVPSWQIGTSVTADHTGASPTDITNTSYVPNNDPDVVKLNSSDDVKEFFEGLSKGAFVRYISKSDPTVYNGNHSIVFAGMAEDGTGIYAYEANQDGVCGVGYQKYTFAKLDTNYTHVLYYVNHSFPDEGESENGVYHLVHCENCDGYLRQKHSIKTSTITSTKHTRVCTGCKWISTATHTYSNNVCTVCGYVKGGASVID